MVVGDAGAAASGFGGVSETKATTSTAASSEQTAETLITAASDIVRVSPTVICPRNR
jgi:hypothetical protein